MKAASSIHNLPFSRKPAFSSRSVCDYSLLGYRAPARSPSLGNLSSAREGWKRSRYSFIASEKETMQDLNDRLAVYLEKVRSLEAANQQIELKIKEFMSQRAPASRDYSAKLLEVKEMRNQIHTTVLENVRLLLAIDNAKLTAEDYRAKWETEAMLTQSVEGDIAALKKLRDDHKGVVVLLKKQIEDFQDDVAFLKKSHEEEVAALRTQIQNEQVTVEIDSVQGPDLPAIMAEIRERYEAIAKKNKEEVEAWYSSQVNALSVEVKKNTEAVESAKEKITEKRQIMQSLEVELEGLQYQIKALEVNQDETIVSYENELSKIKLKITLLEQELSEIQSNMHSQKQDYEMLLRIKETLEAEIAEYRRLLEGEREIKPVRPRTPTPPPPEPEHEYKTRKIVKVITQVMVDGKVVDESSEVEQFEETRK
uniref:Si:ch211-243g18.2 n=1 Tax=Latimeria chalumnae TaxID=7897 RepID=H3A9H2_LATCH